MKKISSKIIISLLLAIFLWSGMGFVENKIYADNLYSGSTGITTPSNETIVPAATAPTVGPTNSATVAPTQVSQTTDSSGIRTTRWSNGYSTVYNPATLTLVVKDASGNVTKRLNNTPGETPSYWGEVWSGVKDTWKTAVDIGAGIFSGPWFLAVVTALSGILAILSGLLSIVAAVFDGIVHLSISAFRTFVDASSITESWTIIRDAINICFIFILLYIAITTIIGGAGVKVKVQLKNVIIGALLINFSLFFTRIIIDGGNLVAMALYNKLSATSYGLGVWGLTGKIINGLQLQELWSPELIKISGQTNAVFVLILSIILVALTLWAFLYGAILFLLRNIMLLFLMAISPIGFIGGTLPWFEKRASEWWSALVSQVMVAPFFLFIMFMLVKFTDASANIQKLVETKSFWTGSTGLDYAMYINAFLIIGLLVIGTKETKKLAGKMGSITESAINAGLIIATAAITGGTSSFMGRIATKGATMAEKGGSMIATGRARMASFANYKGGIAYQGGAATARKGTWLKTGGSALKNTGDILSGQAFKNAAGQPNTLGIALTSAKENFFKTTKKETGIDLDSAFKYKEKMDKEYEKRYGDIANKIGGKKERDELDILNNIDKNIKSQAENQHKRNNKADWDAMEAMVDPALKKAKLAQLKTAMKIDVENNLTPQIAKEMGVDLAKHNQRKDELKITIEQKTVAKNQYAASISDKHKKFADIIRSKATYEAKNDFEKDFDKILKGWMKKNPPTATPPTP